MLKIVAASDLSDRSAPALARAARLARSLQAALCVLHVSESSDPEALADAGAALTREIARSAAGEGLRIDPKVVHGDPCERIVQLAQAADLLVMGEPRRKTLREFFIGSTAHRILVRSSKPALIVRTRATAPYRRTVFAVDLSAESARIIETAGALGLADAHCAAVHVYASARVDLMVETAAYSMTDIKAQIRSQTAQIESELAALMAQTGQRGRAVAILERGSPADSLRIFARTFKADLIVLGSRRRTPIARIALGSVAEKTLVTAPCDILLVPPAAMPTETHEGSP